MSWRTCCCKKLSLVFAVLAMAVMAAPAFAQNNCLKDVSRANSCTANDVSLAAVLGNTVNVYHGGIVGTNQCIEKGKFSFTATFEVKTTSTSTRSNIGIYFGTGQNNALNGTCSKSIPTPKHWCPRGVQRRASKCTRGTLVVSVMPVTVTPKVAKACNTTVQGVATQPRPPSFDFPGSTGAGRPNSCDAGPEGSTVAYTVAIKR